MVILASLWLWPRQNLPQARAQAVGKLQLTAPLDYQVHQRFRWTMGTITVAGALPDGRTGDCTIQTRQIENGRAERWKTLTTVKPQDKNFRAELHAPAGGWRRLEVRLMMGEVALQEAAVEHVGIGEIFVIAGQSNSANHGEKRQQSLSGRAVAFHDGKWRVAHDPQPGASGDGGSFIPPFADAMVRRFDVPIGIVACGVGATSVREWLPRGSKFPNPPTLTGNVKRLADGQWESKGTIYDQFTRRIKQLGPGGFRAVLWHQGESDANQKDASRTLSGELYRKYMQQLIDDIHKEAGTYSVWFVAQASYHTPEDPGSEDIRAAQKAIWKTHRWVSPGPDTDVMIGDLREAGGKGVHFSDKGLKAHGAAWAQKVAPVVDRILMSDLSARLWTLKAISHEPLLFVHEEGQHVPSARLLFAPDELPTITDASGRVRYEEGRDYDWEKGSPMVTLKPGSRIPFKTHAQMFPLLGAKAGMEPGTGIFGKTKDGKHGVLFAEGHYFHDLQVQAHYPMAELWRGERPWGTDKLGRTMAKLAEAQPLKMATLGDSISEGYNASGFTKAAPFQPAYPEQVALMLRQRYGSEVAHTNFSKAGTRADWGLTMVEKVAAAEPDLVVLAFGMNHSEGADAFERSIKKLIDAVRARRPLADIILVAPMTGNPEFFPEERFTGYLKALKKLEGEGIAVADVTTTWIEMLKRKPFHHLAGNNVNHPNDFGHRLYAQVVMDLLWSR